MANKVSLNTQTEQNANPNSGSSKEMQAMLSRLEGVLSVRHKNNPAQATKELENFKKQILAGTIDAAKLEAALDKKTKIQVRKEELEAEQKILRLKLAQSQDETEQAEIRKQLLANGAKQAGNNLKEAGAKAASAILNGALNFGAFFDKGIEEYASIFAKYSASVEARLQDGSKADNSRFKSFVKDVKNNLAASPFLKQEKMLDNLNELIQLGVNYNIEQRAFLQSMTDKVVTTFNAFDSNLLNLIRLQQADSTAARMGMEATLTKSFNAMFKDTSYLSNTFDSVSQALFETIAQLGRDEGLKFEYVVQKWLGSLGSVGVSDNTLTKIASAINYLGTGNIQALQGDAAMMNLITLAANRQGLNISSMITQGLNSDNTNMLLRGIVDQIQEIATKDNQVVRQQFGQLFGGVTMADMVAILNMSADELKSISNSMLSYSSAIQETASQLEQIPKRMHVSELIDNVIENFKTGIASNIASSAGSYITWQIVDFVEQLTGGINIPTITVMGSGIDLETTVTGLMKTAMVGVSTIGQIGTVLANLSSRGGLSLDTWGYDDALRRDGAGFTGITSGYKSSTSGSAYIGSSSGSDMASHSVASASQEGTEQINSAQDEEDRDPNSTKNMLMAIRDLLQGVQEDNALAVKIINSGAIPVSFDTLTSTLG